MKYFEKSKLPWYRNCPFIMQKFSISKQSTAIPSPCHGPKPQTPHTQGSEGNPFPSLDALSGSCLGRPKQCHVQSKD